MEILASEWLRRMVNKAGNTPQSRIVALFDLLQDWMEAPGLRQALLCQPLTDADRREIQTFFLELSRESGAADPEALSSQLLLMLLGAINQELRSSDRGALTCAGKAANLLLAGHCRRPQRPWRMAVPAIVAGLAVAVLLPSMMIAQDAVQPAAQHPLPISHKHDETLDPDKLAAVYHMHDEIRSAQCAYPQALMLPPEQRAVYLENVVSGNEGNLSVHTLELVNQLYRKVECYYPPAALL